VVFIFFSTFGLANRLVSAVRGDDAQSPMWLTMAQAITMPLQGLANGIVFSKWVWEHWRHHGCSPVVQHLGVQRLSEVSPSISPSAARQPSSADEAALPPALAHAVPSFSRRTLAAQADDEDHFCATICATTWNVGEAAPPADVAAELASWLPAARDVYLIGLQECLQPQAWRTAIGAARAPCTPPGWSCLRRGK
jgi:hypothetical protein